MHTGHRDRMRNKILADGVDTLVPHEILEVFLYSYIPRKDTNSIAHDLIDTFGSLSAVLDADLNALLSIPNMTKQACIAIKTIPKILQIYLSEQNECKNSLANIKEASKYIINQTRFLCKEKLFIICLDLHFKIIKCIELKSNLVDRVNISMKEIHTQVLRYNTKCIIIAHNHPSGNLIPSNDDILFTQDMINSMAYIDIEVIDHIIVSGNKYFSFKEKGLYDDLINDKQQQSNVAEKNY